MSKIFVTGDTHGEIDIKKLSSENFQIGDSLTKNDYVVILGDFALPFSNEENKEERYWLDWLSNRKWTTLVVDGNHENFDRLNSNTIIQMFGNDVGVIAKDIFHLKRGKVYDIAGEKIFVMGGASSIDKSRRIQGVSWWPEEVPSYKEFNDAFSELDKFNWNVDYVFSHTSPLSVLKSMFTEIYNDPTSHGLDTIAENLFFKEWFFGHFHEEKRYIRLDKFRGTFHCLYESIVQI